MGYEEFIEVRTMRVEYMGLSLMVSVDCAIAQHQT